MEFRIPISHHLITAWTENSTKPIASAINVAYAVLGSRGHTKKVVCFFSNELEIREKKGILSAIFFSKGGRCTLPFQSSFAANQLF